MNLSPWIRNAASPITRHLVRAESALLKRTPRERYGAFICLFVLIALVWYYALYLPGAAHIERLDTEANEVEAEANSLETRITALEQEREEIPDPNEVVRDEIAELESRIEALTGGADSDELTNIAKMTPAEAINRIQRRVINTEGIRLTRFYRQPGADARSEETKAAPVAHRRMELAFEADYHHTLALIERLEAMDIPIIWRSVSYEAEPMRAVAEAPERSPTANVTIRFDIYATTRTR